MLVVNLDARPDAGAIAAALASDRLLVGLCRGALNPAAVALAEALDTTIGA